MTADTTRVELDLTEHERMYLAADASQHAANEQDFRYWTADPAERALRLERWRRLAAMLYPEGYSSPAE